MGVLGGFLLKPIGVANKAAIFTGSEYGNFGQHAEFEISEFEVDLRIFPTDLTANERIFSGLYTVRTNNRGGFLIFPRVAGNIEMVITRSISALDIYDSGFPITKDVFNTINIKVYNSRIYFDINGNTSNTALLNPIRYSTNTPSTLIGAITNSSGVIVADNPFFGNYDYLNFWKLNSSGTRTEELMSITFNDGNINTSPNTGADAPASSDMTWVPTGSGTYVDL